MGVLVLGGSLAVSVIFKELKEAVLVNHPHNRPLPWIFSILLFLHSVLVVFFNKMLGYLMRKLSCYEKHETCSKFNVSVSFKTTVALFINTAIIPILTYPSKGEWFINGGLVSSIFYNTIAISFLEPLFNIFDIHFLVRLFRVYQEKRKKQRSELTQQEANLLMQGN